MSKLPLSCMFKATRPFALDTYALVLQPAEAGELVVSFDPNYRCGPATGHMLVLTWCGVSCAAGGLGGLTSRHLRPFMARTSLLALQG